jgi:hypothetical protein
MRKTLYESLRVAFPELNDTAIPEEQDEFEHFVRWLNSYYSNIQKIELDDFRQNGIDECHRLQQLGIDLDELKNQINDDMASFYQMYDSEEEETSDMHGYDFEFSFDVIFNHIKIFIEPYELSLLVIERENPYWLLVPHNDELIDQIIVTYNHTFGDEEPMQLIE